MQSPNFEDYDGFDQYHHDYVQDGQKLGDMPDHPSVSHAVILGAADEDVIYDGWHRFHDYVRKGVTEIPCVVLE